MRNVAHEMKFWGLSPAGTGSGCFETVYEGAALRIISSDERAYRLGGLPGTPWEHVSVTAKKRTPNWAAMSFVKDLFWLPEEAVMQLHPPRSTWVNNHPLCLHLFRPVGVDIPLPPSSMVGDASYGVLRSQTEARAAMAEIERKNNLG